MGAMKERMLRGELYRPDDPELLAGQERCARLLDRYNATAPRRAGRARGAPARAAGERRRGRRRQARLPLRLRRRTSSIGDGTFVNFDCVMLDIAPIALGRRAGWPRRSSCWPPPIPSTRSRAATAGSTARRSRSPTTSGWAAASSSAPASASARTRSSAPARWSRATSRPASSPTATPRASCARSASATGCSCRERRARAPTCASSSSCAPRRGRPQRRWSARFSRLGEHAALWLALGALGGAGRPPAARALEARRASCVGATYAAQHGDQGASSAAAARRSRACPRSWPRRPS